MPRIVLLTSLLVALGGTACSPGSAFCARLSECADDPPGRDFEKICLIQYDTEIDALNANEEESCHTLADAKVTYTRCVAALECVDFNHNDRCTEESEALFDASHDIDGHECTARD